MATIKDVAQDAGVSLGTVSKVINGLKVGESYKKRVEASIKKLNYQVNPNARGLRSQNTNDIAVIVPTLLNPLFPLMVDTIEKELTAVGKRMLICISRNDTDKIRRYLEMATNSRVDGIFGVTYSRIDESLTSDMPIVSFDRHFTQNTPCVSSDNYEGGRLAAEILHKKGSKRLLCFWTGADYDCEPIHRIDGFRDYCNKNNIEYNILSFMDYNQVDTGFMMDSGPYLETVRDMIHKNIGNNGFNYDGIFTSSDHVAYVIKSELESAGYKVPEDVQIIGFDGIPVRGTGLPIVSSIRQAADEIAKTGIHMLLELIDTGHADSITNIPVEFVEGDTTRH